MSVIDDYLGTLQDPEKRIIEHMYEIARRVAPSAVEELCYAMPSFTYKNKGLVSVIANKNFISVYPFCSLERLDLDFSAFEHTSGSLHFSADKPISDDLFRQIVTARMRQIDAA